MPDAGRLERQTHEAVATQAAQAEPAVGTRCDGLRLSREWTSPDPRGPAGGPGIAVALESAGYRLLQITGNVNHADLGPGDGLAVLIENTPVHGEIFDELQAK